MPFNSLTFAVFFLVVYALFWIMGDWKRKKLLLLVASYCFYAAWSPPYIFILLFSTVMDWWLARLLDAAEDKRRRQHLLLVSLACNLMLLGYFKYGGFLLQNFASLLAMAGINYDPPAAGIILPIGISFYTFASLSYTIDVYRRDIKAEAGFTDYALFVSFFPHLVAGPIVRASYLLPQIAAPRRPSLNRIGWGLSLVLMGIFAKSVMADALFAPVVDNFYAAPSNLAAIDSVPALLSFSGQIYYDFCGYTLCAIGLAMCFGFAFPDNFRYPYAARSFSDFWRRWHISLSTWLRDYVYIPLGGNRHGKTKTAIFLLCTMLIGGLWHGASWMFVLWGALHGSYLLLEKIYSAARAKGSVIYTGRYRLRELLIFVVITLTWIPFRAATPAEALSVVKTLSHAVSPRSWLGIHGILAVAAMIATVGWHIGLRDSSLERIAAKIGPFWFSGVLALCLMSVFLFSGGDQHAFIYFQF